MSGVSCGSTWAQTFSYDAFGNISKSGSASWLPSYTNSKNQYLQGWNGASYDNNGFLLNDTFNTYTWDLYGDVASANGQSFTSDAFGRTVEGPNGTSQWVYAPVGRDILGFMNGQSLANVLVPLPGGAFAVYNPTGLAQYNHPDWQGSMRLFSTPTQGAGAAMAHAPFGEGYAGGIAWDQFAMSLSHFVYDNEGMSGTLLEFPFRKYSPGQGRWISPDPAGLSAVDPMNPQTWNRYAYVANNPLNAVDPSGLDCVYLNDEGSGVEAVDSGNCDSGSGGYYIPGTVDLSSIIINSDAGTIMAVGSAWNGSLSIAGAEGSNASGAWTDTYAVGLGNSWVPNYRSSFQFGGSAGGGTNNATIIAVNRQLQLKPRCNGPALSAGVKAAYNDFFGPPGRDPLGDASDALRDKNVQRAAAGTLIVAASSARSLAPAFDSAADAIPYAGEILLAIQGYQAAKAGWEAYKSSVDQCYSHE
ncbi:MAG TPA: RHS repeat-associated core domain-containing protein [Candidatus Sulfotelmatobacter sp.]|nr:RHS repeat-associated core domain-containing protein [Candidatus Sulfotelmatobacter sp.]